MNGAIHILSIAGTQSIFDAASQQAEKIRALDIGFIIAALGMLLLVTGLMVYIIVKYRAKDNAAEPSQTAHTWKLEILMVGMPLVLIIVFFFWSVTIMNAVMPDHGDRRPDIIITGHQWWWQAYYPGTKVSAANEIHLPVGKEILMELNAADVIHDWWVPAFGAKMDMIPGMHNYLWVTINKPGIYDGTCSEFCGQQHAWMRIRVVAQSEEDYNRWLAENSVPAKSPTDSLAKIGEALFLKASCSDCHSINGINAKVTVGPDLTHFSDRETMLTGMMANNPANVEKWLTDPQKVKPGAHMPRFLLAKDSIRALTTYLTQLK